MMPRVIGFTLALLISSSAFAIGAIAQSTAAGQSVEVGLDGVSEVDQRRLTTYAKRIFSALGKLAKTEGAVVARDDPKVQVGQQAVERETLRYVNAAVKAGLSVNALTGYLTSFRNNEYSGPVPNLYLKPNGELDIDRIVFSSLPKAPKEHKNDFLKILDTYGAETQQGS